ncbi:hypothetical protein Pla175_40960 [Pirellulimonas nuda]|uniref:Uncharacterized protein n=1 Tax=Pirellulimonas nuda TaxID=2528009 RepID=A0A518DGU1_9BACT|nr:hypothetical protein [Pirellulimonas nuda]QDU90687.1 hypothetical protein Pla175_40960 [Pirellulimonas nuda]
MRILAMLMACFVSSATTGWSQSARPEMAAAIDKQWGSLPAEISGPYRYAYSADGYNQDRDDVAGSAMAVAIFDRAGKADRIAHFHFNTNFGGAPSHAQEHRKSALQTAVLFGIIEEENGNDAFFDVARSPQERLDAIDHFAGEIKKTKASDPLMVVCAGGVQTVYLAVEEAIAQGATEEALRSTTFFSHSDANEKTKRDDHEDYRNNWQNLKTLAPASRFIDYRSPLVNARRTGGVQPSQNSSAWNQGPRGGKGQGVKDWQWLADYGDAVQGFGFSGTKGEWLLTRLKAAGAPELGHNANAEGDASDAAMVYVLMGGQTDATMDEIKTFFCGPEPSADE